MRIPFTKMEGCGNDYVYLNGFLPEVEAFLSSVNEKELAQWIEQVSDRHFGVGGDGVIIALPFEGADGRMWMFNADGSEGKMCGNGVRCVAKLIYDNGIAVKDNLSIMTGSGMREISVTAKEGRLALAGVQMGQPIWDTKAIPFASEKEAFVGEEIVIDGKTFVGTAVSMGNPHFVIFGEDPETIALEEIGPKFEKNPIFPESVNTEFARIITPTHIQMRVWERGSGETLACGTGASAVAAAAVKLGLAKKDTPITLSLRGGDLFITVSDDGVLMEGPARTVFEGWAEYPFV